MEGAGRPAWALRLGHTRATQTPSHPATAPQTTRDQTPEHIPDKNASLSWNTRAGTPRYTLMSPGPTDRAGRGSRAETPRPGMVQADADLLKTLVSLAPERIR